MKARTKVLLTSIASIAMCASIAVGGTYALFTDSAAVNVAVTSGTVDVSAVVKTGSLVTYSRGVLQTPAGSFANDADGVTGAVINSDSELTLTNITPGDKAEFVITVTNASNVDIQYRTVAYLSGTGALKDKLVWTSSAMTWTPMEADSAVATQTVEVKVSVELPDTVTQADLGGVGAVNSATVAFTVEAVQGNGVEFAGGAGTAADPWLVETAEQFNNVYEEALKMNEKGETAYVKLYDDVDLTGVEIENSSEYMSMVFDGNGKTIKGVSKFSADGSNRGLFAYLENSTVKNLNVEFAITNGGYQAGMSYRTKGDCTFENVTVKGEIKAATWASGFVAYPNGNGRTEGSLTFINCVNNATLRTDTDQSDRYGAGFVAHAGDAKSITFENCVNNGNIIATQASGFVGMGGGNNIFTFVGTNTNNGTLSYTKKGAHFSTAGENANVVANGTMTQLRTFTTAAPTDKLVIDLQDGAVSYKVTVSIATQCYNYPGSENVWGGGFPVHVSKTYDAAYVAGGTLTTDFGKFAIAEVNNTKKNHQDDTTVAYNGIFFDINQQGVTYVVGDANSKLSLVEFNGKTFFYVNNSEYHALLTSDMLADDSKSIGILFGVEAFAADGSLVASSSTQCYVKVADIRAYFA